MKVLPPGLVAQLVHAARRGRDELLQVGGCHPPKALANGLHPVVGETLFGFLPKRLVAASATAAAASAERLADDAEELGQAAGVAAGLHFEVDEIASQRLARPKDEQIVHPPGVAKNPLPELAVLWLAGKDETP